MNKNDTIANLLRFIKESTTPYHAVQQASDILLANNFKELKDNAPWDDIQPGSYFVTRNMSSLIAFHLKDPIEQITNFRIAGSHTDSPCLKVKPNPIITKRNCVQVGVEVYGGALLNPWFDRDLGLAGAVSWSQGDGPVHQSLIDFQRPVGVIPSLAIHLDREANNKKTINKQTDIVPLTMLVEDENQISFTDILLKQLKKQSPSMQKANILDYDLFFYDFQPPAIIGLQDDFLTGARFDNLLSCYALLQAISSDASHENSLVVLNDHEEVGSVSTTGAQGTFLHSIFQKLFPQADVRSNILTDSFFFSVDNAHAFHPNFMQMYDEQHMPEINEGIVLKKNANQRYATNNFTGGFFKHLCHKTNISYQEFVMRNDMACGSTIGPMTSALLGIPTVDIGIPQLAMHSIRETVGSKDVVSLCQLLQAFFQEETNNLTPGH